MPRQLTEGTQVAKIEGSEKEGFARPALPGPLRQLLERNPLFEKSTK